MFVGIVVGIAVAVGVEISVGSGVGVRVGVADAATVGVAVGNTATDVVVGAGPHAANSKRLKHTTTLVLESRNFILFCLQFSRAYFI